MKTIFLGTAWESLEALKVLHKSKDFEIVCVITTTDKPVGRKQVLTPSAVKKYALENNIPIEHTENKKENYLTIQKKYKAEIGVCKAFGEIIPKEFIDGFKYGCINIHFSILPKYRGAVPIQKAILDGEEKTGISIMLMSEGLDEGDVLEIFEDDIKENDTNVSLRKRLVEKSSEVLVPALTKWIKGDIVPKEQNHKEATYCWQRDISKEKAEILWGEYSPEHIERMVRAFVPWPVAWTLWNGKRIKIFDVDIVERKSDKKPGELFSENSDLYFSTNEYGKCIRINEFQIEGKTEEASKQALLQKILLEQKEE